MTISAKKLNNQAQQFGKNASDPFSTPIVSKYSNTIVVFLLKGQ